MGVASVNPSAFPCADSNDSTSRRSSSSPAQALSRNKFLRSGFCSRACSKRVSICCQRSGVIETVGRVASKLGVREQAPALQRSPEILHQHQVASYFVDLREQEEPAVRRNRKVPP